MSDAPESRLVDVKEVEDLLTDADIAQKQIDYAWSKALNAAATSVELLVQLGTAQARIDKLEAALYKVLVARTYDTVFDETEIWELEDIAREALKDTTNE